MSNPLQAYADSLPKEQRARIIDTYVEHLEERQEGPKFIHSYHFRTPKGAAQGFRPPARNWKAVEARVLAHLERHPYDAKARADYERRIKPKADAYKPKAKEASA